MMKWTLHHNHGEWYISPIEVTMPDAPFPDGSDSRMSAEEREAIMRMLVAAKDTYTTLKDCLAFMISMKDGQRPAKEMLAILNQMIAAIAKVEGRP